MDINQNIVRIRTAMQMGTGIIYPCEPRNGNLGEHNYIIFTNKHLVRDIPLSRSERNGEDLLKYFQFDIYDKEGRKLEISSRQMDKDKISAELFYTSLKNEKLEEVNQNMNCVEDIAVILLSFHRDIDLDLETRLMWGGEEIDSICMEGFPEVLSDNDISSKLLVKGIYKPVFPSNSRIGVFQITDDYHWYNNYKDYRLFQGFSGSPIFQKLHDRGVRLLGMNQSVLNIENGENPFKLMYYYKMPFILEYLREQGCILFSREKDESAKIRWIAEDNSNSNGEPIIVNQPPGGKPTELTLLLLGASGAGKSSFVKSFLLHSKYIDSTNDGQTTRSSVIYEISQYQENPIAKIKFLNQKKFVQRMKFLNYHNYLYQLCLSAFGEQKEKSLEGYLRYFCYDYSVQFTKDNPELESKIKEYNTKINNLFYEKVKKLNREDMEYRYYTDNLENLCEEILQLKFSENKHWNGSFVFSQTEFFKTLEEQEKLKSRFFKMLDSVEGFFDKSEFAFLNDIKDAEYSAESDSLYRELELEENQGPLDLSKSIQGYFEEYYKRMHREIIKKIIAKYLMKSKSYEVELKLDETFEQKILLTYALQKKGNFSLTGMVDSVTISDSISNAYAFIFDDLKINKLKMIDTYGLDHADWNADKKSVLSNMVYNLNEEDILKFDSNLAVVYVKKLDSGNPTELHNIVPDVFELIPMAPIYCVFTGLDIFVGSDINEFKSVEHYFRNNRKPKNYGYIESVVFEEEIKNIFSKKNAEYIDSLYSTMKNNLIAICSDENTVKSYFNLYANNRDEVYKLLTSISMNEYTNMVIIPEDVIDEIDLNKNAIESFLGNVFEIANVEWTRIHWKTAQANFTRISGQSELGYWGTFPHQWNQLFHMGYTSTVINSKGDILGISKNLKKEVASALDSCIRDMEYLFLGDPKSLSGFKDGDSKFRKLLEKMYDLGFKSGTYKINPFDLYEKNELLGKMKSKEERDIEKQRIKEEQEERLKKAYGNTGDRDLEKTFLIDICNFSKGFDYISNELCDLFIESLKKQINITNTKKAECMIKINREFIAEYLDAKYKFESKYNNVKFETLIKAYIDAK